MLYDGEPGEIELVADRLTGNSELDWFVTEYGGGVMVIEPKVFGRVFVRQPREEEDLVFVSRFAEEH